MKSFEVKEFKKLSLRLEVLAKASGKAERMTILWRAMSAAEHLSLTSVTSLTSPSQLLEFLNSKIPNTYGKQNI